ncbi:MAG: M20 family metallopeptidase [Alphaproteobacteria bacterium]|nr:M20 family metallopeptidase [Alphaproteobacteria bacterium]
MTRNSLPFDDRALLEGIRAWVEIESPTTDAAAVNRMTDAVEREYRAAGALVERWPGRDGFGDHIRFSTPWGGEAPGILVLSHLDTVHPHGMLKDVLPFRIEDDFAFGPGISDMKGGTYLALAAMRHLIGIDGRSKLPVRHLILSDEEVGSPTSRQLIEGEARRARYVLVTEPARDGGRCVTARKGSARFTLRVRGRAAHAGSRHQEGRSAIRELCRQVLELEAMTDYDSGLTVNVGVVQGGTRANVVPYEAVAEIDMRVPTPAVAEIALAKVMNLKPIGADITLEVSGGLSRAPYDKSPAIAALFERARALAAESGLDLKDTKTGGNSDGNLAAPFAPVLDGLGVDGMGSSHSHHEKLRISTLAQRAHLLLRLMQTLD